jgi:hypothetical protein
LRSHLSEGHFGRAAFRSLSSESPREILFHSP